MKGFLNQHQIEYVFFHLGFHIQLNERIKFLFHFNKNEQYTRSDEPRIYFNLSSKPLDIQHIEYSKDTPILFPNSSNKQFYHFDDNNLIFEHDLLKSIFFLLSGYQELKHKEGDYFDRFPFTNSIQYKLGMIKKPVVNYYFQIIIEGLEKFAALNSIELEKTRVFNNFGLLLTHDIDFIDAYTLNKTLFKLKLLLGLKKSSYKNRWVTLNVFLKYLFNYLNFIHKRNPHWNFDFLRKVERDNHLRSVFFFLEKDQKFRDSFYKFSEPRLIKLYQWLQEENCEVGIHGTINSSIYASSMEKTIKNLEDASGQKIYGIRQHCLAFKFPETAIIHDKNNLLYDSTLGFAAHEGFRHSYCHPFKLYDFERNKPFDVWELPLNVMDGTLFGYRSLSFEQAKKSINEILEEIKKFNGLFTLLWHNDFFDEDLFPGITQFYENLLRDISKMHPENYTGKEIVEILENT